MQLNAQPFVAQFGHVLQQDLFPVLHTSVGPLTKDLKLLTAVMALVPLDRLLLARRAGTGRPAKDRAAMATAYIAKAILNLPHTRHLLARLRVDEPLRRICGWSSEQAVPGEWKFSRVFAEFAESELPQQLHAAVIEATQKGRLIGHIARDSTAIPARERFPVTAEHKKQRKEKKSEKQKQRQAKQKALRDKTAIPRKKRVRKGSFDKKKAAERDSRIVRQRKQKIGQMLSELPTKCDIGTKINSQGNNDSWRGYKLHCDTADGQIIIAALLTSASVHDSQAAIPLMTISSQRVTYFYELSDSAYDACQIAEHSRQLEHIPITALHGRRASKKATALFPAGTMPQLTPAQEERFKGRTMSERVNARLKDEFGGNTLRVRGPKKVMAHLMFGVLALTVDQILRFVPVAKKV
jgi:hypothetical protein